jgi:hypothetical protein
MAKKFVAVLNKSAETVRLMNAIGHISIGLAGRIGDPEALGFILYRDANGQDFPDISAHPYILLKTNDSKLKGFRQALIEASIPYSCFTDTMIEGGFEEQVAKTALTKTDELNILAVVAFGEREVLDPLTRKFSLFT